MISAFRKTLAGLAVVAACIPAAYAQVNGTNQGYLVDQDFKVVTAVGGTVCVRTSDWTPARAAAAAACKQCTPDLCPAPPPPPKPAAKPEAKPEAKPAAKPAPKPEPRNVELKIELQGIEFNKTEMTADNKKELDEFMTKEVKPLTTIGAVIITGHTDRIGSDKYNKTLSEKRALGVKDYVVGKGIDQKLIFWEGKGPKQPIPVTKFCDNKMKRKQLIECLAPNRRVTVEVVGTILPPPPKPKPEAKPAAKP
ncbi:MAG: OmpA family protein [Betaproteobacteria bacterium]|nr:OmpA family protein [Betaproteobacteria bacterium]